MTERPGDIELADMYVRNELDGADEADFEVRMLESPQLQQHVKTALAIRESLKLEEILGESPSDIQNSKHHKPRNSSATGRHRC